MSAKRTIYKVGRGEECDISIPNKTVSRLHAEIIVCESGEIYYTDSNSTNGSFYLKGEEWHSVRQSYVSHSTVMRLGDYESSVSFLLSLISKDEHGGGQGKPHTGGGESVERDEETGEVIKT